MRFDPIHSTENIVIDDLVDRSGERGFTFEYNCDMSRIYPWSGVADTKRSITEFGLVWVEVEPGTEVDAHEHDEEESFCIVEGRALLKLEKRETELNVGDIVYIPRYWRHQMCNPFKERLKFIDIYWDDRGRPKSEAELVK